MAAQQIRQARGRETVLLLHGGDTFSDDLLGNLTQGEAVIRLMNEVGYQFAALGNHDFDYGADRTRALQRIARFAMRGAKEVDEIPPLAGTRPLAYVVRYAVTVT